MPVRGLSQIQIGTETTWGTPVTPTAVLMGVQKAFALQHDNKSTVYDDVRNNLAPGPLAGLEQIGGKGNYDLLTTYEDICYIFDSAFGQAAPTGTGPYTRNYSGATSALPSPRILTVVDGNSQTGGGVYTLRGGLVDTIKIVGATGKPTMVSGNLIGQAVDTSQSLQALSARTVQVVMPVWTLYIDTWAGTIGTTTIATTAVGFTLDINLNRVVERSLDSLTPDLWEQNDSSGKLALTLRMNANTKTQLDALVGQTDVVQKQVRLKATSGTNILQLDFAGTITNQPKVYDDQNGILTTSLELEGTYNSDLSNWFKAQVVNSVAVLA